MDEHRGEPRQRVVVRWNEPQMCEDPLVRFAFGAEKEDFRDQVDECIDANQRKGDHWEPFGPIIHSNWNGDKHGVLTATSQIHHGGPVKYAR